MDYKSPIKKLVKFFLISRDKWKERALEKQKKIEQLEVKVRDLSNSRDKWKEKYKQLKANIKKPSMKEDKLLDKRSNSKELMHIDNKNPAPLEGEMILKKELAQVNPWSRPVSHIYNLCTMHIAMELILSSLNSFRGAMKAFKAFSEYYLVEVPSWVTIENWILRFGLYELQRPIDARNDWIYILDHTVQAGRQKGLVILGVTKEHLRQLSANSFPSSAIPINEEWQFQGIEYLRADVLRLPDRFNLSHQDVRVLKIIIDEHSNGDLIYQHLNDLANETGVPVQIISDHGSDLKRGVDLFVKDHSDVCYTYDITHEIGLLLKKLLEKEPFCQKFLTWCGIVRQKVLQTELGFLAPPAQKSKSRYLNLAPLIGWGCNLLKYQEKSDFNQINPNDSLDCQTLMDMISSISTANELQVFLNQTYSTPKEFIAAIEEKMGAEKAVKFQKRLLEHANIGALRFDEYFGDIQKFKKIILNLVEVINVIQVVSIQVKNEGLNNESAAIFLKSVGKTDLSSELSKELVIRINHYLETEGGNIPQGQTLLGTSDIIESIFGKYKLFTSKVKLQGISQLILTIPAFTANITPQRIKEAFETIRSIDVKKWLDENLGPSILAKRRQALN